MFNNKKLSGWRLLPGKEEDEEDDDQVNVPNLKEVQALKRIERRLRRLQILAGILSIVTLVTVIIASLLWTRTAQKMQMTTTSGESQPEHSSTANIAGNEFIPEFQTRPVTFEKEFLISGPPSNKTNWAWKELFPEGGGWVSVHNPESYGLPEGKNNHRNDGSQDFAITMYHQLHCVEILRTAYYALRFERENLFARGKHVHHCFDYLVQSIRCTGDLTLEWPKTREDGLPRTTTEGWGVTHQCVDSDAVFAWAEAHAGVERENMAEELELDDQSVRFLE